MRNQNGNALFIVFVAIGLIAALTFVAKQNTRGGTGSLDRNETQLIATDILQSSSKLAYDLKRFLLINEYDITEIDLYDANKILNGNNSACSSSECNLFDQVSVPLLPTDAYMTSPSLCGNDAYNGQYKGRLFVASVEGLGTDLGEVILTYYCVKTEVCERINLKLGLREADEAGINQGLGTYDVDYTPFSKINTVTVTPNFIGSLDSRLVGKKAFCHEGTSTSYGNFFHQVLLVR